jgi:branched-chain amino acid transport system ATP-binding protein
LFPCLAERLEQRAETLSGGEQPMLAISRALTTRPRLLMLDEPSQGIAPKSMKSSRP